MTTNLDDIITMNTIATIRQTENNTFRLRLYKDKAIIYEREYKKFSTAQAVQTKLIKKYKL